MILYRTLGEYFVRPVLRLVYRAEIRGRDRIPAGPVILAANHESYLDPFVLGLATRRPVRYMAKAELYRNHLVAAAMRGFGTFPIERGRGDRGAIGAARELLEAGQVIGIFPQGTCRPLRNRPFLRGAARLALETGAPIVPVCLVGTERALRPKPFKLGLPKIRVLVGDAIRVEPARPTIKTANELMGRVEQAIAELRRPYGEPAHAWID